MVDKIFYIKGKIIFDGGFRPALIGLADEVGVKAHAANLKDKKQIRVVASGSYSNIQTYHKNIRTKELQLFDEEVPKYTITQMKNYDGPDIDWNGYNQQFMSAQLAKSVGFFTYLDKKMEAMHNDIKKESNNNHHKTKRKSSPMTR
jgi:acylphosphatase